MKLSELLQTRCVCSAEKRQENLKLLQTRNFSKKKDRHRAERETLGPDKNYAAVPVDLNGWLDFDVSTNETDQS